MKTSIIISSIAALCLLVTFAEAPRRHGEDKTSTVSTDNISIATVKMVTMLPGVIITSDRKKEAPVTVPATLAEDFSYLKFSVTEYMGADAANPAENEVLPEASESDYSYLKFEVSDYTTDAGLPGSEISEWPVNENNARDISSPEPGVNEFEYLRFDVNDYMNFEGPEAAGIGELPSAEAKTGNQAGVILPGEATNEFSYLKFDVTKYYSSNNLSSEEQLELPED